MLFCYRKRKADVTLLLFNRKADGAYINCCHFEQEKLIEEKDTEITCLRRERTRNEGGPHYTAISLMDSIFCLCCIVISYRNKLA